MKYYIYIFTLLLFSCRHPNRDIVFRSMDDIAQINKEEVFHLYLTHLEEGDLYKITTLPNLESLFIVGTEVPVLPFRLFDLPKLKVLGIQSCHLRKLPPDIQKLHGLEKLYLENNELEYLPEEIWELKKLKVLSLSYNRLSNQKKGYLAAPIRQMEDMEELYVEEINAADMEAICSLEKLRILHVRFGQVAVLPEKFYELSQLEELTLNYCGLTKVSSGIQHLQKLKLLDLKVNLLSELPASLSALRQLKELNLNNNRFTSFPAAVTALESLENLDVSSNEIKSLPQDLTRLRQLKVINIRGTYIPEIPLFLKAMPSLEHISF